ncbi:MAG: hypothetical protein FWG16_02465 [Micrococcales bacterium]|nr:hypothetical protein [Micrococcales bacterium]
MNDQAAARAALEDPTAPAEVLQDIAWRHPELRLAVAAHPNAYAQLRQWIQDQGTSVDAVSEVEIPPAVSPWQPGGFEQAAQPHVPVPTAEFDHDNAKSAPVDDGQPGRLTSAAGFTPQAAMAKKAGRGRLALAAAAGFVVAVMAFSVLLITGTFREVASSSQIEGPGYSSPEEAAQAFLEGLRDEDFAKMAGTFAVESFVEKCNYTAFLERLGAHTPTAFMSSCVFPEGNKMGHDANVATRQLAVSKDLAMLLMTWVSPHLSGDGVTQALDQDDLVGAASGFQTQTETDFSSNLFTGISNIKEVDQASVCEFCAELKLEKVVEGQLIALGLSAEDYKDVILTFDLDGKTWMFAPAVGRYHGRWYLIRTAGVISSVMGISEMNSGLTPLDELDKW